jgi:hypothetical protein
VAATSPGGALAADGAGGGRSEAVLRLRRSIWVIAARFHPLEPLADVVVLECEFSGALKLQQDGPIFHADPVHLAVTVRERVINSWHAPLRGEDFRLYGFAHFTGRATSRSCCWGSVMSNFSIHSLTALSASAA